MFWKLGRELFSSLQWSWAAQQSDKVAFGHTDFFLLGQLSCNFNYFSKLVIQEEWNYAREWFTSFLLASISGNKHKEQIAGKSQRRTILSYIKHVVCIIFAINTGTRNRVYPEQPEITQVPGCRDVGVVWWYCWPSRQALSSSRKKGIVKMGARYQNFMLLWDIQTTTTQWAKGALLSLMSDGCQGLLWLFAAQLGLG